MYEESAPLRWHNMHGTCATAATDFYVSLSHRLGILVCYSMFSILTLLSSTCKCFIKKNIRIWSFAESHSSVIDDDRLHVAYVRRLLNTEPKWPPFADDIFKCTFLNENVLISIKISLQFVHISVCPIHNKSPLVKTSHYHSQWRIFEPPDPMLWC